MNGFQSTKHYSKVLLAGRTMVETVAMIAAGYAGYAAWPWWSAALLGAAAGAFNVSGRIWRERSWVGAGGALMIYSWTITIAAALYLGVYGLVYWLVH